MGVAYGINPTWAAQTDAGRTHIATKGIVQSGLVLNLDAGVSSSYDKYENLTLQTSQIGVTPTYAVTGSAIVTLNTTATTAPNGLNEASLLDNNGSTGANYVFGGGGVGLTTNTTYTYSIHIKQKTKPDFTITIDENSFGGKRYQSTFTYSNESVTTGISGLPNDGVVVGSTATKLSNGWYRLSLTFTTSTNAVSGFVDMINRFGNASGSNYVWGRQLEKGSSVTDYYATTSSVKNRGTTLIDLSGNGKNGTLTNGPTYNSANGGSIVFDGTNDYVVLTNSYSSPSLPTGSSARTVISCFKTGASIATPYEHILHYGSNIINQTYGITLYSISGSSYISNHTWFGTSYFTNFPVSTNTIYYVAVTYNDSSTPRNTFFVNGTFGTTGFSQGKTEDYSINTGTTYQLNLGTRINPLEYFGGSIYFAQIYNRALTAQEISQNFNAMRGRFGI